MAAGYYSGYREDGTFESKTFTYDESGGEMDHKLITSEMPSHNHDNGDYKYILRRTRSDTSDSQDSTGSTEPDVKYPDTMSSAGGDVEHNNLQPYYVLYACIKSQDDANFTSVSTFQNYKLTTNTNIDTIETDIDTIENQITSLVNETTFVKSRVTELEIGQADTENDVETLFVNVDELQNETVILSNDITSLESESETLVNSVEILETEIDIIADIIFRGGFGNNTSDSLDYTDLYNLDLKTNTTQLNDKIDSLYTLLNIVTATTTTPPTTTTTPATTTTNIINAAAPNAKWKWKMKKTHFCFVFNCLFI